MRDESTLKKVVNIWETYGPYNDYERVVLIEAINSNDLTVFCSATRADSEETKKCLGRRVSKEEKAEDFHLLDYEPDLTHFVQVCQG